MLDELEPLSSETSLARASARVAFAEITSARRSVPTSRASTWPFFTFWPCLTNTFFTVPEVAKLRSRRPDAATVPVTPSVRSTVPLLAVAVRYDVLEPRVSAYA